MKKRVKLILTILIICTAVFGIFIYSKLPNFRTVVLDRDLEEFKEGQINVVIGEKRINLENPVLIKDDKLYLPFGFVEQYITNDIFWDSEEKILTITNPREMMRLRPNKNYYQSNYVRKKTDDKIIIEDDIVYIPYAMIKEKYNIVANYNRDTNIIVFDDTTVDRIVGVATKSMVRVRMEPDIKSPVLETIYKNDEVMTYLSEDGWTQVRTTSGNVGYVNEKHIEYHKEISKEEEKIYEPHPIKNKVPGSIVLAWDQVGKGYEADFSSPKYENMVGVNVLSPTWLEFKDSKGNLLDRGSKSYVDKAHDRGYQVWPLMSHNFSNSEWTHEILSSTKKRDKVIKQLADYVDEYNVDGINIDIENLQQKTGPYWVQFMRELYPIMKEKGIYVSTDVYVPSPWTLHYNREEIAKTVDYFVVMAYDEHWSGSEEAGSVGSIPWVQEAIESTLEEVPEDKVILGVPFYSRLWKEEEREDGQTKTYHVAALGMNGIKQQLKNHDATSSWDEETGQYYAEYEKEGARYRTWIEDETSIKARAQLLSKYDLAGIAGWKLGLETPQTWKVINEEIKKRNNP